MYALRGSWVGQTFTSAASNSSGERKSRTRLSKEDRKALAVSFIKRYQSLNEGNFPSLNLTHKEVGGSFYTVREIVREIIQENKVLGPADYTSEVDEADTIAHDYPLGSICMEPHDFSLPSENGTNAVSNLEEVNVKQTIDDNVQYSNHQDLQYVQGSSDLLTDKIGKGINGFTLRSEDNLISIHQEHENLEVSLNSNGHQCNDNAPHNGKSTDVIDIIRSSSESDDLLVEQPVKEKFEVDGKLGLIGAYNANLTIPTKEVEVETFPLRPAIKETDEAGSTSIMSIDRPSSLVTEKEVDGSAVTNLDGDSGAVVGNMLNHDREVNIVIQSLETPESLMMKKDSPLLIDGHVGQVAPNSDLRMSSAEESKEPDVFQAIAHRDASSKTSIKNASKDPLSMAANEYDTSMLDQSKRGTAPTLDRIHLESWPRTLKQGINPFLAFINAFKDAFVKFLSA